MNAAHIATSAVLAVGMLVGSLSAGEQLLLVGNKREDTLSFVDTATGKVIATTSTGRGPHELAATPDGKWAFVANYEGPGDSISLIDVAARNELRRIPLGSSRGPHGIVVSRDGRKVYATCERSRAVIELDVGTENVTRSFATEANVSHMLVLTPDETRLYTANIGSGSATAIDLKTGKILAQIPTGAGCEGIDITPDGKFIWTTNREADSLSVIDTKTNQVVATLPCRGFPIRVKITPDGKRALVSSMRSGELTVFDVAERREVRRISTGSQPVGTLITPDGRRAYVANTAADRISVIDLESYAIAGSITAGREPDGLALAITK